MDGVFGTAFLISQSVSIIASSGLFEGNGRPGGQPTQCSSGRCHRSNERSEGTVWSNGVNGSSETGRGGVWEREAQTDLDRGREGSVSRMR
jgi:hypothetical protein